MRPSRQSIAAAAGSGLRSCRRTAERRACCGAEGAKRPRGALISFTDQLWPAAAVDEEVVEGGPSQEPVVGGVDDGQALAKSTTRPVGELELEALTTRRVLERVPDNRLSWRPHARARTLGALDQWLSSNWRSLAERYPVLYEGYVPVSIFDLALVR